MTIRTENGIMEIQPKEIAVVQRGIKFAIECEGNTRGWFVEIYKGHFVIPDLGPIGTNGMANPRDFQTPVAWYEDVDKPFTIINKFGGKFFNG